MKNERMRQTCTTLAAALHAGLKASSLRPERVQYVPSIHENGMTMQLTIDGERYVAEFRHVDDEVV